MVARLSAALRDLVLAAAVLVATMVAVRVGLYGDLGSALGAVGVLGAGDGDRVRGALAAPERATPVLTVVSSAEEPS